jgi:transposase-like protein
MKQRTTAEASPSTVTWETLEAWTRERIQAFIQALLEEEVTSVLGRGKSERRAAADAAPGYRNGYGKPRRLSLTSGTITLQRPRVRNLEARFESQILPLFARRTQEVGALLPELYLHGLAQGDFELALRGLLGDGAPLSASSLQRLKGTWEAEYEAWRQRDLSDRELVYLWADGLYVKAGLERDKAALLVVIGALRDGTKEVLAVESGMRESTEAWKAVLRALKGRGLRSPRLTIADGHLGIWGALAEIYPESAEQRCWNHKLLNVLEQLPRRLQAQARALLAQLPYAETQGECERLRRQFVARYGRAYPKAVEVLERDWERMVTFYRFPREHWKHLRTTNVVESPFAAVRLRTDAAKRYKRVANATALIWKVLMVAQQRFRRLDAPELLADAYHGVTYVDGFRASDERKRGSPPEPVYTPLDMSSFPFDRRI